MFYIICRVSIQIHYRNPHTGYQIYIELFEKEKGGVDKSNHSVNNIK